jgi:TorA maturation chaperone TorD
MPGEANVSSREKKVMTDTEFLVERSNAYRLLSACFYEPDRNLFLEEDLCGNLAKLTEMICPEGAEAAKEMAHGLQASNQDDLAVEHATLFIGPFELPAPPYGSVYLEKDKRLMGDSTMEVQRAYAENGLKIDVQEPPDHIAFELEFMHYLCRLQAEASEAGRHDTAEELSAKQSKFVTKFMGPWVPRFCADIRKNSDNGFYVHLADCLEHFIAKESADSVPAIINEVEKDHAERAAI